VPDAELPEERLARRRFARAVRLGTAREGVERIAARRMAERLDYVKISPQRWLDAGCGAGDDVAALRRRYPASEVIGLDSAAEVLGAAARGRPLRDRMRSVLGGASSRLVCGDMARLPFPASSFDAVWSNLALAWLPSPNAAFAEFQRVLRPGGLLAFCTYGPDSLKELKEAFASVDSHSHVHGFTDMHDLGDLLVASGFAAPVMDMDIVTFTYESVHALAAELRGSGQTHVGARRRRGLMGRDAWERLVSRYEALRRDGRIPATVELVFGHAWKPQRERSAGVAPIRFHR
jgi:malonyl-CoA O-methyltransferase